MGRGDADSYSVELCGGTHVNALGDIQLLKITSESAVAAGVRRIEAMTGEAARRWLTDREDKLRETAAALKAVLVRNLSELDGMSAAALVDDRYARFRAFGSFTEGGEGMNGGVVAG